MEQTDFDKLTPGQRFARATRALFAVSHDELQQELDRAETRKSDGEPKKKPGPAKGSPNWRAKRKQEAENNERPVP